MGTVIGPSVPVFLGVTVILMGGAAYMTGQALAGKWRPLWQTLAYSLLLGCADRFAVFALFEGDLYSPRGYVVDTAVLIAIALFAHRTTQARKMVAQYPWLYERAGLFGWRNLGTDDGGVSRPRAP